MKKAAVKANSNIALIKYWGKKDENLIIPYNDSISLTLEEFYTITKAEVIEADKDEFYLNGDLQEGIEYDKFKAFVDLFREKSEKEIKVKVESKNYFPTAAGLASSASGYAALAGALDQIFDLNLSKKEISIMARKGSGSASRSVFGGLVQWHRGNSDQTSFAEKIEDPTWDIGMLAIIVNDKKKKILSRAGMKQTVETCPYYKTWVESTHKDIDQMRDAINRKDFEAIGKLAEFSALKMHATMMATDPSIIYMEGLSIEIINRVKQMRAEGIKAYFTMDAGPNVKIITQEKYVDKIKESLSDIVERDRMIYSGVGKDLEILEVE